MIAYRCFLPFRTDSERPWGIFLSEVNGKILSTAKSLLHPIPPRTSSPRLRLLRLSKAQRQVVARPASRVYPNCWMLKGLRLVELNGIEPMTS